jgi:CBS domain-containing protein
MAAGGFAALPVLDADRLVGIVSRRDVLRALGRPDEEIAQDVRSLVESYTGRPGGWTVEVGEGVVRLTGPVVPARGATPVELGDAAVDPDAAVEATAVGTLARTVAGVVAVRVGPALSAGGRG